MTNYISLKPGDIYSFKETILEIIKKQKDDKLVNFFEKKFDLGCFFACDHKKQHGSILTSKLGLTQTMNKYENKQIICKLRNLYYNEHYMAVDLTYEGKPYYMFISYIDMRARQGTKTNISSWNKITFESFDVEFQLV